MHDHVCNSTQSFILFYFPRAHWFMLIIVVLASLRSGTPRERNYPETCITPNVKTSGFGAFPPCGQCCRSAGVLKSRLIFKRGGICVHCSDFIGPRAVFRTDFHRLVPVGVLFFLLSILRRTGPAHNITNHKLIYLHLYIYVPGTPEFVKKNLNASRDLLSIPQSGRKISKRLGSIIFSSLYKVYYEEQVPRAI